MLAAFAERYLPALGSLSVYRRDDLSGDLIAGIITAILLLPAPWRSDPWPWRHSWWRMH